MIEILLLGFKNFHTSQKILAGRGLVRMLHSLVPCGLTSVEDWWAMPTVKNNVYALT